MHSSSTDEQFLTSAVSLIKKFKDKSEQKLFYVLLSVSMARLLCHSRFCFQIPLPTSNYTVFDRTIKISRNFLRLLESNMNPMLWVRPPLIVFIFHGFAF